MVQAHLRRPQPGDPRALGLPRHRPLGPGAQRRRVPGDAAGVPARARLAGGDAQPAGRLARGLLPRPALGQLGASPPDGAPDARLPGPAAAHPGPARRARHGRIVGLFYFGQDERLADEAAVRRGVDEPCGWLLDAGYTNVIVEINNECDVPRYEHEILQPQRVHELIELRPRHPTADGRRLLVGTQLRRRSIPGERVLAVSDLALLHGNSVDDPAEIGRDGRAHAGAADLPADADRLQRGRSLRLRAAGEQPARRARAYASWGYFDPGAAAGGSSARGDYVDGYQLVPVNWRINTPRKRAFFDAIRRIIGA